MSRVYKKNKLLYYLRGYMNAVLPPCRNYKDIIQFIENQLSDVQIESCLKRVDYYCKASLHHDTVKKYQVKDLRIPKKPSAYYVDTYEYARYFDPDEGLNFVFGDVTQTPDIPSIVKSRPVENNTNSVLLNLDKARHFVWVEDTIPFSQKKNLLIGRAAVYQPHRMIFFEKYFGHHLCDLGQVNKSGGNLDWWKPKISLKEHLKYKFILSLQGNDVATNLKWIMSSQSLAVMPKPTLETWFMEGTLQEGVHYVGVKSDYSDLEEQLIYYTERPKLCREITDNANRYCRQFRDPIVEAYCSLKVLEKYFGR